MCCWWTTPGPAAGTRNPRSWRYGRPGRPGSRCWSPPAGSTPTSAATRRSSGTSRTATTTRRSAPGPVPPARPSRSAAGPGRGENRWREAGIPALAGHMKVERFDARTDGDLVRACHEIYLSGVPVDDPHGPPMSPRSFAGWLALGFTEDPQETWLARDDSGEPCGWYVLSLPQRENRHLAPLSLTVHAARRRAGLGTALLRHAAG